MSPYEKYRANVVNASSKEQKMVMIFDEIIKILHKANNCIENEDFEGKNKNLRTAAEAFYVLRNELDIKNADEFTKYFDAFCYSTINKIESINMSSEKTAELDKINSEISQVRDLFLGK
jgi:flagellar biosynthetic protein FliS